MSAAPCTGSPADPVAVWRPTRHACLAVAVAISIVHFASFDIRRQPIVTDVRYFLYFSAQAAQGAVAHRDFFDNKAQLASYAGGALYALGGRLGVDPLLAIRAGALAVAALIGVLLFTILRELSGGDCVAGLLGLLAYAGFALLGVLPSIGMFPKLLMALFASASALLAYRERWLLAGACGALAASDWQIGGVALLGALAAAAVGARDRLRACGHALAGAAAVGAAIVLYFWANGALDSAYGQVVAASFARGASALGGETTLDRLQRIVRVTELGCPGHVWLVLVGVAGMLVYPLWLARHRDAAAGRLALALAVYHYGVVAFSVLDFQLFGDLFALLQSVAFFAGVALSEAFLRLRAAVAARAGERRTACSTAVATVALLTLASAVHATSGTPDVGVTEPTVRPGATLDDQRAVAHALAERLRGGRVLALAQTELLFLGSLESAAPFVYWNDAAHSRYRESPDEAPRDSLHRLILSTRPDAIVYPEHRLGHDARLDADYAAEELASPDGDYRVVVLVRRRS